MPPFALLVSSGFKCWPRFLYAALFSALIPGANAYTGSWPPPATATTCAVPMGAVVTEAPPQIQLNFPRPGAYQIFRKGAADTGWSGELVSLPSGSTTWTDTSVTVGQLYEYKAVMTDGPAPGSTWSNAKPVGYVLAGIKVDQTQPKGRLVLVVTTDVQTRLAGELAQFQADLVADGWFVHVISCTRAKDYTSNGTGADTNGDTVPDAPFPAEHIAIRNQIIGIYNAHPGEVKNIILLGRVPACRTGVNTGIDPDGHGMHISCWGADSYYANMTGTWTDTGSNLASLYNSTTKAGSPGITVAAGSVNVPGDNKFDQSYMSQTGGKADMGFGRIDLSLGIAGEYEALRFYFSKLHRYKTASPDFLPGRKIAIRGAGYSNVDETGWLVALNITSMANVDAFNLPWPYPAIPANFDTDSDYSSKNGPYLLYFRDSGAPAIGVGGKVVFWTGMQSFWGYWYDSNVMATKLGEDSMTLSFTWDIFGLHYFYHRMGMGFDAGDMVRVSINNTSSKTGVYPWATQGSGSGFTAGFDNGSFSGSLFMNHIGDPTLRLYMFSPPTGLSVVKVGNHPSLGWTASTEPAVIGYHVYRSDSADAPFVRLTVAPVAGTSYTDGTLSSGTAIYMVRAVRLETTGGGTFYNPSLGVSQSIDLTNSPAPLQALAATLPDVNWNTPYPAALTAAGGAGPYIWTLANGSLPPGMTLNPNGTMGGTATMAGVYSFTAIVTDQLGSTAQRAYTLTSQSNASTVLLPEASTFTTTNSTTQRGGSENLLVAGAATTLPAYGTAASESFLRFDLSGLNTHNTPVRARLRLTAGPVTTANTYALVQVALCADGADGWSESATGTAKAITAVADNGSGYFRITCAGHGIFAGSGTGATTIASVTGTGTLPNGVKDVTVIDADTFDLPTVPYNGAFSWSSAKSTSINGVIYINRPKDNPAVAVVTAATYAVPYEAMEIDVTPMLLETLARDPAKKLTLRIFTPTPQTLEFCSGHSYGNAIPQLIVETSDAPAISIASPSVNPACLYAGSSLSINATVTPIPSRAGSLTLQWAQVSGPAVAVFSTPYQASTAVTFPLTGDYVLRLSADDGALKSYKDVTVRVLALPAFGPGNSMVLRMPFDEQGGTTAADASGVSPANSGTLVAGGASGVLPSWLPTGGRVGGALSLAGGGQRVDVPDSSVNLLDGGPQLSISFWVYINALDATAEHALVCKRRALYSYDTYTIKLNTSSQLAVSVNSKYAGSSMRLSAQKWYHVVMVFDGTAATSNLRLYLDGSAHVYSTITSQTTVPRNSPAALRIGAFDSADTVGFNGRMDEVRIYNKALTLAEIGELYAAAPANIGPVITTANAVAGFAGQPFSLTATVTDDGTPGVVTQGWSALSGPGSITFGNTSFATTTATCFTGGLYTLRLTASDGAITTTANVTANVTGQSFESWAALHGLSGLQAAATATPAGDGVSNLVKYALGLNPGEASTKLTDGVIAGLPKIAVEGNQLTLLYQRDTSKTDIIYSAEASSDLTTWSTAGVVEQIVSTGGTVETVKASISMDNRSRVFFRLKVTK